MLQRAAKNAYSWWWASHIRTKQSKWLDQNLQDMEEKVDYILKIIDEDGETFAQKAEMYYRKRPELMNFVEDSFRCYRALAERYDHLSRELQSANRTIATVFPERVQLEMDDEDEGSFKSKGSHSSGFRGASKGPGIPPTAPNLNSAKLPSFGKTSSSSKKLPSRLMSKKGLIKINAKKVSPAQGSGLKKAEALEEIDRLQKEILGLQTEGEFLKSSYGRGMEKYLHIENQVTEKQAQVNSLQEEFGVGTVFQDDEARMLMTNSALKSCREALSHLQEVQKQSMQEAREEHQRIQEAREKMESMRKKIGISEPLGNELENKNIEKEVEEIDVEMLRLKVQERLGFGSGTDLTMTKMADKVDEMVDNIVNLETVVCSQKANLEILKLARNELQDHLQSLERNNEGSDNLSSQKIMELGEEFRKVQTLDLRIQTSNKDLQVRAAEESIKLEELSLKLPNVKPDEELDLSFDQNDSNAVRESSPGEANKAGNHLGIFDIVLHLKGKKEPDMSSQVEIKDQENSVPTRSTNPFSGSLLDGSESGGFPESNQEFGILEPDGQNERDSGIDSGKGERYKHDTRENSYFSGTNNYDHSQAATSVNIENENKADIHFQVAQDVTNPFLRELQFDESFHQKSAGNDSSNGQVSPFTHIAETSQVSEDRNHEFSSRLPDIFEDGNMQREANKNVLPNQEERHNMKKPEVHDTVEDEGEPDWKRLFISDLDDKERILLQEYTNVLINYKEVKKKLSEVEKKRRASLFQSAVQIKVLTRANASNKAEIESLKSTLDLLQGNHNESNDSSVPAQNQVEINDSSVSSKNHDETIHSSVPASDFVSQGPMDLQSVLASDHRAVPESIDKLVLDLIDAEGGPASIKHEEVVLEENGLLDMLNINEALPVSSLEDKIRTEIDDILEENIEFWLRFSTSFHQIQKFQTSVNDLQAEVARIKEKNKQDGSSGNKSRHVHSEIRPIYRHLREIQTELGLLLEQNGVLKDDLQHRLSSLSNLQEEITRMSNAGQVNDKGALNEYQAAKFQGEIMNMKHENNKVAAELELGLEKVKQLHSEIQLTLGELDDELGIKRNSEQHRQKSRIPLRSFLFGAKLKKQKPSFFSCINPVLYRQDSDLTSPPKT